jgi:hypothetical protein
MSSLIVSNLSDGTLSIPTTYVTNGSAKAWVNFNGTGTIAARDSFNVASLTDNGTGDYTVNFSNAFGAGDYAAQYAVGDNSISNSIAYANTAIFIVGSHRFFTVRRDTGATIDVNYASLLTHGDLA